MEDTIGITMPDPNTDYHSYPHYENGNGNGNGKSQNKSLYLRDTIGIEIPDPNTDYHGHPQYGKVYVKLLLLFGASVLCGLLFSKIIAVSIIFSIAVIQASLVLKNFMHMKYEPLLIWIVAISILFSLFMLFYGVYIDIIPIPHDVLK